MATNSKIFAIELTNNRTYLFRGRKKTYEGLTSPLGIKEYDGGDALPENGTFESEQKPPRIRVRTKEGKSYERFINPDKVEEQVYKRKLIGKKIKNATNKDETICFVSIKSN